jgi:hypothetical protein
MTWCLLLRDFFVLPEIVNAALPSPLTLGPPLTPPAPVEFGVRGL